MKTFDKQLEATKDELDRIQNVFSRRKGDIDCCSFVEIYLKYTQLSRSCRTRGSEAHDPPKSDACRNKTRVCHDRAI